MFENTVFGRLDQKLQHAIKDAGYEMPTPIQEKNRPRLFFSSAAEEQAAGRLAGEYYGRQAAEIRKNKAGEVMRHRKIFPAGRKEIILNIG